MLRSGSARTVCFVALVSTLFVLRNTECATAPEPGDLRGVGKVTFPITCEPDIQSDFARGVALLHSFFYEEARRVFTSVAERDPKCAMAQWGIAMTWWHPIWTPPTPDEMRAGKAAIQKAMAISAGTDREREFITALNVYYNTPDGSTAAAVGQSCHGPVGPRDRVIAYEKAMRQLRDKYPDDFEVQTFYAFAVLAVGYANPTDTSLSKQLEAAAIFEKLRKQNANHPGAVHYLIHCYDYPALAQRGLSAAQSYDSIAPWVPHALHMPSHIFTRLGMWDESIAAYALAAIPTRYAFEQNDWKAAAALTIPNVPHWSSFPFMEALIEYGHALGRVHTGDIEGARKAIARMQELRDATKNQKFDYFKSHLDLQMKAASAWIAATEGNKSEAIEMLHQAADAEDILGKHPVSPGAFVPIREQLGSLLLEAGQSKEAQREFEAALKIYPARFRGLYGAAQAAEQSGDKENAGSYYSKLASQTAKSGGSRDELNHVREFRAAQAKAAAASNDIATARE